MDNQELTKRLDWYSKKYGPYVEKRGLHNWKNLFRKPTVPEWIIFVLLLGYFLVAQLYVHDIEGCSENLNMALNNACQICNSASKVLEQNEINLSNINIIPNMNINPYGE